MQQPLQEQVLQHPGALNPNLLPNQFTIQGAVTVICIRFTQIYHTRGQMYKTMCIFMCSNQCTPKTGHIHTQSFHHTSQPS